MAKNLRAKIPATDTLVIYDRNAVATTNFVQEVGMTASNVGTESKGTGIVVAKSPRGVAENSVSCCLPNLLKHFSMMSMFQPQ